MSMSNSQNQKLFQRRKLEREKKVKKSSNSHLLKRRRKRNSLCSRSKTRNGL